MYVYSLVLGKTINLYLYDIDQYVKVSLLNGIENLESKPKDFIKMHTESLAFVYDFDFGIDTFGVAESLNQMRICLISL